MLPPLRRFTNALWASFGVLTGAALFLFALGVCLFAGMGTQCLVIVFALLAMYALTKR